MAKQKVEKKKTVNKIIIKPKPELVAQKKAQEKKNQNKSQQAKNQKRAPNGRFA